MGGTTEGADVLSLWLASRQPMRGQHVAAPAPPENDTRAATPDPPADLAPAPTAQPQPRVHPLAPKPVDAPARPDVEFAPRYGTQRLAGALLLAALAGTAVAGWMAWDRTSTTAAGVATIGLLLAIGLWFLRAASVPPRVRIASGVLHIEAHGERHTWDLTNPYVRLTVRGRAGRSGWQVLLLRPEQSPYVVDASVVQPKEFMAFLRSYRPEL